MREMERSDLPEAAAMFARVMRMGGDGAVAHVAQFFERALFDCPWADAEIPSYVVEDDRGRVVGMVGSETRRLRLDGRTLRVACAGFLAVTAEARGGLTALELMRGVQQGPQDVTVTDSANEHVERLCRRLGGTMMELKAVHWVRVWRPWSVGTSLAALGARRPRDDGALHALAGRLDDVMARAGRSVLAPPPVTTTAEPLTPELVLEHVDAFTAEHRARLDYDATYLRWVFAAMGRSAERGRPVAELVRDAHGRALGWYVYYLRPGRRSEVMQVVGRERDLGAVLDHLLRHAYEHGSAMVRGRLEPGLTRTVVGRRCVLWYRGGTLVRSREPGLAHEVAHRGLLSRLDTNWHRDVLV
jgi:hypothetical protein